MIETIERSGTLEGDVADGGQAAELLGHVGRVEDQVAVGLAHAACLEDGFVGVLVGVSHLLLAPSFRQQALRSQDHHDHQQEAVDPEGDLRHVEVEAELARHVVQHVRDQPVVDERQHDRAEHDAPDRAEAAEDDHAEDQDREVELELVGVDGVQVRAEEGARHAAERGAGAVGQQLRLDGRDAHRDRGDLVLAQRDPRAARAASRAAGSSRTARSRRARARSSTTASSSSDVNGSSPGSAILSTGVMPCLPAVIDLVVAEAVAERAADERQARELDLVAVDGQAADDLAERERHDRDVVAAQAQRRQADDHARDRREDDRGDARPGGSSGGCRAGSPRSPTTPMWMPSPSLTSEKKPEPSQPIVYAPIAKNAT